MKCKFCQSEANNQVLTPATVHYGKLTCASCGNFLAWLPYPVKPVDKTKLPKRMPYTVLPEMTGASQRQIDYGKRCRTEMIPNLVDKLEPELWEAMQTIVDATFWIANLHREAGHIRWPREWS